VPGGFTWINCNDADQSALAFARYGNVPDDVLIAACNFTPVPRLGYRIGVPRGGYWLELLNSDARAYGGTGHGNLGSVRADHVPFHGQPRSLSVTLPPLAIVFFKAPTTRTE
jgi:1,4-alpha-glucan branching enzyme